MLDKRVQGALRPSPLITWAEGKTFFNLTGATITARLRNKITGVARASQGDFVVVDAAKGQFRWDLHADDVAEAGEFEVRFTAAFGIAPSPGKSYRTDWIVEEDF